MSAQILTTIVGSPAFGIALASGVTFLVIQSVRDKAKTTDGNIWAYLGVERVHTAIRWPLAIMWTALFLTLFSGIFWVILYLLANTSWDLVKGVDAERDLRWYLLTLTAMTTVLGVTVALPFTLIRTKNLEAQTKATEQGLVTDRLNKAVEGLGAQKEVNWIGRPVTIWTGQKSLRAPFFDTFDEANSELARDLEVKIGVKEVTEDHEDGEVRHGYRPEFQVWSEEVTVIEKQGGVPLWSRSDLPVKFDSWEVFKETLPNLEVRIGSIYALERIAVDNPDYHLQIVEILCAYIRQNAPANDTTPTAVYRREKRPRDDIQAVITVLGRRSQIGKALEAEKQHRLDLRRSDLDAIDFTNGDFSGAQFHNCRIEGAFFQDAIFRGTEFFGALLNHVRWHSSDLRGARLNHCILNQPEPSPTSFYQGFYTAKDRTGITLGNADISAVTCLGETPEINVMFGDTDTILSDQLDAEHWADAARKLQNRRFLAQPNEIAAIEAEILQTPFATWSPHGTNDLSTVKALRNFWQKHSLTEFPFHGTPPKT